MSDTLVDLRRHNADYGFDGDYRLVPAPVVAGITGATSAALLASAARSFVRGKPVAATVAGATGASLITTAALFVRTTRVGKFEVWAEILDGLGLRGDEALLDMGCGRGAVLLAAAKLLPNGRAIGVDIWRADQTDNSADNTLRNAALEGVADRVEVHTADITDLPPHLIASGDGHVVNISSVFGLFSVPGQAAYNAAKFAVRGFTEALSQEMAVAGHPVKVTTVHPGGIKTAIVRNMTAVDGIDTKELAQTFDKKLANTSPQKAARIILDGVRKNKARVLVGPDAKVLDLIVRVSGSGYQRLFSTVMSRMVPEAH